MHEDRRRHTLGKRGFAYRYPNVFIVSGITISMCLFFSKPIYDIFFAKSEVKQEAITSGKS